MKIDQLGEVVWQRVFGGVEIDVGRAVQQSADDGYIVAGQTGAFGEGQSDIYVIKTDNAGSVEWQRTYGGERNDIAYWVSNVPGGSHRSHEERMTRKTKRVTGRLGWVIVGRKEAPLAPLFFDDVESDGAKC